MERYRDYEVRGRQFLETRGCHGQFSKGGKAGQLFPEFQSADQRDDGRLIYNSGTGQPKGRFSFEACSADMVFAAAERESAKSALGLINGRDGYGTVVTEERQPFEGEPPLASKAVGGEQEFLA